MLFHKGLMLIISGFFLAVLMFGLQVSLTAFNQAVVPENPYALVNIQKQETQYELQVLGQTISIPSLTHIIKGLQD